MPGTLSISVVIPLFNEEKNFKELYQRLTNVMQSLHQRYELIFVDDGSKDSTFMQLSLTAQNDANVKYIRFSRNFGHQIAVTAGLDYASGDCTVIIDGDLQDPPELISALFQKYRDGYQVVYAKRKLRKGDSWFKKITAKLFYRLLSRLTDIDIPVDTGDFRIIDKKIVDVLKQMPEANKFLRGQIAWIGFESTSIEFDREPRKHGTTGYPLKKMIKFALDGITSFSDKPLKFATYMGFSISIISFVAILYAIYAKYFLKIVITGWTSIFISILFMGAIQLFTIGIIGEYIGRINTNVKNRPLYIINQLNTHKTTE